MRLTPPPLVENRLCLRCGLAHPKGKCAGGTRTEGKKIRWALIEGPKGRVRVKVQTTRSGTRRIYLRRHQVRRAERLVGAIRRVLLGTQRVFLLPADIPGGVWINVEADEPSTSTISQ